VLHVILFSAPGEQLSSLFHILLQCARYGMSTDRRYSSIFVNAFPVGRVAGSAVLGGLEIPHGQLQSQIFLLALQQDGPNEGRRCSHSTWSLDELWATSNGCSQQGLLRQSLLGHSGDMATPT